jgi:Domain of unknown function (DUF4224)
MSAGITLSSEELEAITGYEQPTKQLQVLHRRGFNRAFINSKGRLVLERTHYETVTRGEAQNAVAGAKARVTFPFLKSA